MAGNQWQKTNKLMSDIEELGDESGEYVEALTAAEVLQQLEQVQQN